MRRPTQKPVQEHVRVNVRNKIHGRFSIVLGAYARKTMLLRGPRDRSQREMSEPLGHILYRAASILAALVVLFAAFNFVDNISNGEPMVPLPALALALIIWLIGLGCRYVSLARRAERIRHHTKQA
jgi:hydrogenase-4 membrane subunit HyfE